MFKKLVYLFLGYLFCLSISLLTPIKLPVKCKEGGEFLRYRNYQEFAATKQLSILPNASISKQGYWLWSNRIKFLLAQYVGIKTTSNFNQAALVNTQNLAFHQYTNLAQRQAYYRWANTYFNELGLEIRWMQAADKTIGTLSLALPKIVSWLGYSNAEIRRFILQGNKLILDDMLPIINELLDYTVLEQQQLTSTDALKWDAQTLADEQALIQPLYEALSKESILLLESNLARTYGVKVSVLTIAERWSFGMHLMGYLGVTPQMMPSPGNYWKFVNLQLVIDED